MEIAGEVCVDAQPLHVATDLDLLLTHYGTIVLRLTCNHAGITAHARIHVDGHAPLISLAVVIRRIKGFVRLRILQVVLVVCEVRILLELVV